MEMAKLDMQSMRVVAAVFSNAHDLLDWVFDSDSKTFGERKQITNNKNERTERLNDWAIYIVRIVIDYVQY